MTPPPAAAGRHEFTVDGPDERLDVLVARRLSLSRTQAATLIAQGRVTVNGARERSSFRADPGASVAVEIPPPPEHTVVAENIPVPIVFEDEHLVVVDKPAGMVVHPAPGHWTGTLVNALLGRGASLPPNADPVRAGLVHRLDKDTSGLLLVAKTEIAQRTLSADLAARRIRRRYAVLSYGHLDEDRRRVDAPLGRDPRDRRRVAIRPDGRKALTDFVRIARFASFDLLRAHLFTGRTHQIRVHLASIGHPVAGDETYGAGIGRRLVELPSGRHFLHAAWLVFRHPVTGDRHELRCELPSDLRLALSRAADDPSLIERAEPLGYLGFFDGDG